MESELPDEVLSDSQSMTSAIPFVFVLSIIGFGCFLFVMVYSIASPVLAPLAFIPLEDSILYRGIAVISLAITYFVAIRAADWLLAHCKLMFTAGSFFLLCPLIIAWLGQMGIIIPLMSCLCWFVFGIGQGALALFWMTIFSSLPSGRNGLAITLGSCVGTLLFVLVALQSNPSIELAEAAIFVFISTGFAYILSTKVILNTSHFIDNDDKFQVSLIPGSLSVCTQGIVYGYTIIVLCTIGVLPVIIGLSMGILGEILSVFWAQMRMRLSFDIDSAFVQRINLPLIVGGILLMPFFGDTGKIVCGSLVVAAFAHSTMMLWSKTAIDNYEFQLNPIKAFSSRQIADWLGFLIGSAVAFYAFFIADDSNGLLQVCSALMAFLTVAAFCYYGANESRVRQHIELLAIEHRQANTGFDRGERADSFYVRCDTIIEKYGLTKREADVFRLLAKGRNAKFVQDELFISFSTAKTHIYHIYRKLDIGSQQDLIDIVDQNR